MIAVPKFVARRRSFLLWLLLPFAMAALAGCQTVGYYKQAIGGQYQILAKRQPIDKLLASPRTPATLKEKFRLVMELRKFADTELKLPSKGHYQCYVDLHRPFVVWNIHAAPEFSLQPKTWWYPVVGSLEYRGFFSEADARNYARKLEQDGFDVFFDGVEAYSTLGWFKDPLLNTFIHHEKSELAAILFHELAHQRVFARGDTDFNEAFATAVEEEGVRRWLQAIGDSAGYRTYQTELRRKDQFVRLVLNTRNQLESLYAADEPGGERVPADSQRFAAGKREQKQSIIHGLRDEYAKLKTQWGGYTGYDPWFLQPLNNAQLNSVAIYYQLVPAFHRLLQTSSGDLEKFYRAADELANLPKDQRHDRLKKLLDSYEVSAGS